MFDPRNAAKERAKHCQELAAKIQERLDRQRTELFADATKRELTDDARNALINFVTIDQSLTVVLALVARQYEDVASGKDPFRP